MISLKYAPLSKHIQFFISAQQGFQTIVPAILSITVYNIEKMNGIYSIPPKLHYGAFAASLLTATSPVAEPVPYPKRLVSVITNLSFRRVALEIRSALLVKESTASLPRAGPPTASAALPSAQAFPSAPTASCCSSSCSASAFSHYYSTFTF